MPKHKKQSRPWEIWDEPGVAESVDAQWRTIDEQRHRLNLATLVKSYLRPDDTVLEVGCGSGRLYRALRTVIGDALVYHGVDNSGKMLFLARRLTRIRDTFTYGDAFDLKEHKDSSYDLVISFETFGHMPDFHKPLAECYRVARRAVIFSLWITLNNVTSPLRGRDHYEYPAKAVHRVVNQILLNQLPDRVEALFSDSTIYRYHQIDPVAVYVLPKDKDVVSRLRESPLKVRQ